MFQQITLPYSYDALEPVIDALTVETHFGKHHAAYTKNFNDAAEKAGVADMDAEALLASLDKVEDPALRKALRNNGGGFYNHNLYFSSAAAAGQFGSGWSWLSANAAGDLMISASPNQDNPISEGTGFVPILAIDVWEHAYYLKYKNLRPDYIKALFDIIDWKKVEALYAKVTA